MTATTYYSAIARPVERTQQLGQPHVTVISHTISGGFHAGVAPENRSVLKKQFSSPQATSTYNEEAKKAVTHSIAPKLCLERTLSGQETGTTSFSGNARVQHPPAYQRVAVPEQALNSNVVKPNFGAFAKCMSAESNLPAASGSSQMQQDQTNIQISSKRRIVLTDFNANSFSKNFEGQRLPQTIKPQESGHQPQQVPELRTLQSPNMIAVKNEERFIYKYHSHE